MSKLHELVGGRISNADDKEAAWVRIFAHAKDANGQAAVAALAMLTAEIHALQKEIGGHVELLARGLDVIE